MKSKSPVSPKPQTVQVPPPGKGPAKLRVIGGSVDDDFNHIVANQAISSLWLSNLDQTARDKQYQAALMERYRRAMIGEQTFEGRDNNLKHAAKLSRAYAELLGALDKHRGKGQQRVTVEHVHVHQGGRAIVGAVTRGGVPSKMKDKSHAKALAHAPGSRCRAKSKRSGKPCQAPAVKGWAVCRMHGARGGAPKGSRNALKHGHYTAEALPSAVICPI